MVAPLLHTMLHYIRLCWNFLISLFSENDNGGGGGGGGILLALYRRVSRRPRLTFDNGMQVEMGRQIAEGGFSYVFEAFAVGDGAKDGAAKYALKRINCSDDDIARACRHEAGVHRALPPRHPNLLELLGLTFVDGEGGSGSVCYLLFPHVPLSLRGEISARHLIPDGPRDGGRRRRPFATREVLRLCGGLIDALAAVHAANLSHRDAKPENVLLRRRGPAAALVPVLMDYGSAGPLASRLGSRREALAAIEGAAAHTTLPYRPPELCEGGARHGPTEILDYGRVDVWSLGCVLFGLMHGASPFETEFSSIDGSNNAEEQFGLVRVVACTHLKILQEVPFPPWVGGGVSGTTGDDGGDGRNGKYPLALYTFVRYMVQHDRHARPTVQEVARRFEGLHIELSGERWVPHDARHLGGHDEAGQREYDDFDSLITSRDFV